MAFVAKGLAAMGGKDHKGRFKILSNAFNKEGEVDLTSRTDEWNLGKKVYTSFLKCRKAGRALEKKHWTIFSEVTEF